MAGVEAERAALALSLYQDTERVTQSIGGLTTNAQNLILGFTGRYPNPKTRQHYGAELGELFRASGMRHPSELTDADVIPRGGFVPSAWMGRPGSG